MANLHRPKAVLLQNFLSLERQVALWLDFLHFGRKLSLPPLRLPCLFVALPSHRLEAMAKLVEKISYNM